MAKRTTHTTAYTEIEGGYFWTVSPEGRRERGKRAYEREYVGGYGEARRWWLPRYGADSVPRLAASYRRARAIAERKYAAIRAALPEIRAAAAPERQRVQKILDRLNAAIDRKNATAERQHAQAVLGGARGKFEPTRRHYPTGLYVDHVYKRGVLRYQLWSPASGSVREYLYSTGSGGPQDDPAPHRPRAREAGARLDRLVRTSQQAWHRLSFVELGLERALMARIERAFGTPASRQGIQVRIRDGSSEFWYENKDEHATGYAAWKRVLWAIRPPVDV